MLGSARGPELQALRAAFAGRQAGPPAGWEAVQAFEQAAGAVLPEPCRSFVALIADGCPAGPPRYGLVPLRLAGRNPWHEAAGLARLARPFPLTRAWIWEAAEPSPCPGGIRNQIWHGTLLLGDDGCRACWALVVTGTHRGHIWHITDAGAQPFGRSFGYTTAADGFAGWVTHWPSGKDWYDTPP